MIALKPPALGKLAPPPAATTNEPPDVAGEGAVATVEKGKFATGSMAIRPYL
jgi:hypothetical protein